MKNKIYKTRVPYDVVARVLKEMGATAQYDGSEVLLPSGGMMLIFPSLDGGTDYMLLSKDDDTIRFVQRAMARANLMVKKEIEPQPQLSEAEEKEERKKGTDEVSEFISGTSDRVHGGDSASGEVPEAESGKGQDSSSSESHALSQQQDEAGSEVEEGSASSRAPSLSPDLSSNGEGESCAFDSSERKASEGEGSSGDGACLKSLECASLSKGEGDASMDGQASVEEGTGSLALDPTLADLLKEILSEKDMSQEEAVRLDQESGEWSTLPSPSGASENEGEAPAPEREESPSLSFKDLRKIIGRGYQKPSVHSRYSFGGISADLSSLHGITPRELINRARRVFAHLVSDYTEGEEGPRWDYRKVSTRIASYQTWRVFDRKKERGRPAIAVLPDISGSMSVFAKQVLEVSKALMALGVPGAEVITVVQSNGHPLELWVNGKKEEEFDYYDWSDEAVTWYEKVFRRWNARVVVIAADWDGEWLYWQIAEKFDVKMIYWLDVYLSSKVYPTLVKEFPPEWDVSFVWSATAVKKVKYVYGCRDAVDFVKGLELAIRSKK
jgi:hypothetical protein